MFSWLNHKKRWSLAWFCRFHVVFVLHVQFLGADCHASVLTIAGVGYLRIFWKVFLNRKNCWVRKIRVRYCSITWYGGWYFWVDSQFLDVSEQVSCDFSILKKILSWLCWSWRSWSYFWLDLISSEVHDI